MKKLLFTLLLLAFTSSIFSQNSTVPDGIGIFKVGEMTISDFKKYMEDNKLRLIEWRKDVINAKFGEVYLILHDTIYPEESHIYAPYCEKTQVFHLENYSVAGIKIKELTPTFFNDTLIKVTCQYSEELLGALNLEYGEAEVKYTDESGSCRSKKNTLVKGKWDEAEWDKEKGIIARYFISKMYFNDCKESLVTFILISDMKNNIESKNCSEEYEKIATIKSIGYQKDILVKKLKILNDL